jgi:hypothetical protein
MWNLTTLISTFTEGGRADAHLMGSAHPGYSQDSTDAMYDRKVREKEDRGLGWPSCSAVSASGCAACQSCKHFGAGKTPFHFAPTALPAQPMQTVLAAPAEPVSFADPWAEFVGPPFPLSILPSPLANFVNVEHRAMGGDPSALAMSVLTVAAGAMRAETCVRAGEGGKADHLDCTHRPSVGNEVSYYSESDRSAPQDRPPARRHLQTAVCGLETSQSRRNAG